MSAKYLFYNKAGEYEVIESMTLEWAEQMCTIKPSRGKVQMYRCGSATPNALEITSIVQTGGLDLAGRAVEAYISGDPKMAPKKRATAAFVKAFGRKPEPRDGHDRTYEIEALAVIVKLTKVE